MEHNIKFLTRECRLLRLSISVININAFPYVSHHQLFDTVRWWCRCVFHFYDTHTQLEMNDCVKSEVDMTVRVIRQMRRVYRKSLYTRHETRPSIILELTDINRQEACLLMCTHNL